MARGINKVILIGNLGADPEVRYMPNGNPVANLSIATSETWKDKTTGAKQERTEWHKTVVYNRLAEIASEYLKKGSKVYVEGSLRTRKWQDQNGIDRYTTEVILSDLQMLDSRGSSSMQEPYQNNNTMSDQQSRGEGSNTDKNVATPAVDSFDDDIPF